MKSLCKVRLILLICFTTINVKTLVAQGCLLANAGNDVSICPGGSTIIGTPAIPGYDYYWTPTIGLSNPYIAQPIASPAQSTTYTLTLSRQTNNLITNGNFSAGLTGFVTDYGVYPNGNPTCGLSYGSLAVGTNPSLIGPQWCSKSDHSFAGGNMLIIDGDCVTNKRVWSQTIPVTANTNYTFTGWVSPNVAYNTVSTPSLRIRVNRLNVLQNFLIPWNAAIGCSDWRQFSVTFSSGAFTTAAIEIYDDNIIKSGNDFSMDDLILSNCPPNTDNVNVTVNTTAPQILTSSYFYWDINHSIIPNSHNYFCTKWENDRFSHFISNVASGNTWYINDVVIASGGGIYFGLNVSINNNNELIINGPDNSLSELKVQVKNCGLLSQPTYIQVTPIPIGDANGAEFLGLYKGNYIGTYGNGIYSLGFGARYTWSFPGLSVSQSSPLSPAMSINFPSGIGTQGFTGTLTVTSAPHCNGTYPFYLQYNPNITAPIKNELKISPNPAANEILISNIDAGSYNLELLDNTGSVKKKVKLTNGQNQVKVNISDLYSGVYFCNVYSSKGIQRKQFIVSVR